jgi:propanol-preferring alcohol dehydrogenase
MGFGASAHLVLQLARRLFPSSPVAVFARERLTREFALQLRANWPGAPTDRPPEPLDAIIDTSPAWRPVVESLANLRPGGRLVINAVRKEDADKAALLAVNYHEHLWMEREIKTVANITQFDIREFLPIAAGILLRVETTTYRLEQANEALVALKRGAIKGTKVLLCG